MAQQEAEDLCKITLEKKNLDKIAFVLQEMVFLGSCDLQTPVEDLSQEHHRTEGCVRED